MTRIAVTGCGAVTPAGWGMKTLRELLAGNEPLPTTELAVPGNRPPLRVRTVPQPPHRFDFLANPRLRRTSPVSQHAVAAAVEALGPERLLVQDGKLRLGIVFCTMCGCVNYSRRFYDEALSDPATASPLLFPETVFNAPASHLASLLQTNGMVYTLLGDPGIFLVGLAQAADWLAQGQADRALVVGAEEMDWLTADAVRMFDPDIIMSHGAGAVCLAPWPASVPASEHTLPTLGAPLAYLENITSPHLFTKHCDKAESARRARQELEPATSGELLSDGLQTAARTDQEERQAWADWPGPRASVKHLLGEAFMAASAWQTVAAVDALAQKAHPAATVSVVGSNQQAIAARFVRPIDRGQPGASPARG